MDYGREFSNYYIKCGKHDDKKNFIAAIKQKKALKGLNITARCSAPGMYRIIDQALKGHNIMFIKWISGVTVNVTNK